MKRDKEIYHQSVFEKWPLEAKSVQSIITSPPYWGIRKYDIPDVILGGRPGCQHEFSETVLKKGNGDGRGNRRDREAGIKAGSCLSGFCSCGSWKGQYGLETTYKLYIEHTLLWAKEVWRVLKDNGVFFLNLGDSYNSRDKCKLLIPHRIAIALINAGWTLRNDIVWFKKNTMPESVTDRFSKTFEYIFMFIKSPKYYFDLDAIREPYAETSVSRAQRGVSENNKWVKGKNPGDIWAIPTQPSSEKHFAMWPEKLCERMIKCSTQPGDMVLDPFAGSGTTLRVADKLNRVGLGIDLGYQEIQKRRMSGVQKELIDRLL